MQLRFGAQCLVTVTAAACAGGRAAEVPKGAPPSEVVRFELPDTQGRIVRTADYSGRVILVDVWATWCRPCEASMPFYASLEERFRGRGLSVLAVSVDEHDEDVASFLRGRPLPFPVLRDPEGTVASMLEVHIRTMPTFVLLGRDGRVRYVHPGFVDSDRSLIETRVREVLGGS